MQGQSSRNDGCGPHGRAVVLLTHAGLTVGAMLLGVAWQSGWLPVPAEVLCYDLSVALLLLFAWSFGSWLFVTGRWFDPYTVFLCAANVFNAGQAFLEVFGLNPAGLLDGAFPPETTLRALYLVLIGLACLHLGALLSTPRRAPSPLGGAPQVTGPGLRGNISAVDVRRAGWLLLLVSAGPTLLILRGAVAVVLSAGYIALYQQETYQGAARAGPLLSSFLVPAALFLLAGGKGARGSLVVSAVTVLANAACQLFLGFRYYALMPLVAYVWLWDRCIRPVPRWLLLGGGAVMLLVVLPVISATRETRGAERLSFEYLAHAFTSMDNPGVSAIWEMGGTLRTVAYTVELVPARRDHDQGLIYWYGVLTVIPNLGGGVHPAISYPLPSIWLIWAVDPATAARGGGLGYSFIAEAYFAFGWLGAPLVLGLLGFLYGKFVAWALAPAGGSVARLALVATFASFFTFYAREDVIVVFRPLVWFSLGPYLLAWLFANYRRGREAAARRVAAFRAQTTRLPLGSAGPSVLSEETVP